MRQRQIDEAVDEVGAIHLGGFLLLAIERLQRGEQDQRRKGQPLPGDDNDDRKQRVLREPVDRLKTEESRKIGEHAVTGMHDHVLPHQCCDRRHDEKRRDDHDAHDALAEDVIVEQQRNRNTADDGDQKHAADDQKRIPDGLEEGRIGVEILVIEQARKADIGRVQKIVILKREPQGHRQGHDHPDQKQQHRRRHHQPGQPARVSRRHMHPSISGQRAGHCSRCQKAARGSAQGWERVGKGRNTLFQRMLRSDCQTTLFLLKTPDQAGRRTCRGVRCPASYRAANVGRIT
ncbi:hypothetical protein AT6N2_C0242 [Agrobacterium tumefaciens]|nr:hypothetical protein AT6N2_C0242 [Agrobacterium tumefaciens]